MSEPWNEKINQQHCLLSRLREVIREPVETSQTAT